MLKILRLFVVTDKSIMASTVLSTHPLSVNHLYQNVHHPFFLLLVSFSLQKKKTVAKRGRNVGNAAKQSRRIHSSIVKGLFRPISPVNRRRNQIASLSCALLQLQRSYTETWKVWREQQKEIYALKT